MLASEQTRTITGMSAAVSNPDDIAFELGVWIAGLVGFPRACTDAFRDRADSNFSDRSREFRISLLGLQQCSAIALSLRKLLDEDGGARPGGGFALTNRDVEQLSEQLRSLILLNRSIAESPSPKPGEWRAWSVALEQQLAASSAVGRLAAHVKSVGKAMLPGDYAALFDRPQLSFSDRSDIDEIASHVGVILGSLGIIDRMLQSQLPLKSSLIIFAAVNEQTRQLLGFINNRLSRFPDESAPLFNSLDSASYGASLELKKAFQQELRGIVQLIPPPTIHARVETAYSLLLDSFQQMLIDLARLVKADATPFDFFPRFQVKLDESIELRNQLWTMLQIARRSEADPSKENVMELRKSLHSFSQVSISYLHFKDQETFDRFNEEVNVARDKKDLVPILHRFGAYLETLFGQVSMRGVLAGHPFVQPS